MYDRSAIMRDAWAEMRRDGKFGIFTFQQIGMAFWRQCMRNAWKRAKEAARVATISTDEKAAQIASLKAKMETADYLPFGMSASKYRAGIQQQIHQLAA